MTAGVAVGGAVAVAVGVAVGSAVGVGGRVSLEGDPLSWYREGGGGGGGGGEETAAVVAAGGGGGGECTGVVANGVAVAVGAGTGAGAWVAAAAMGAGAGAKATGYTHWPAVLGATITASTHACQSVILLGSRWLTTSCTFCHVAQQDVGLDDHANMGHMQ